MIKVFIGDNFKLLGREELPSESYLNRADVLFDERTQMVTHNNNFNNLDWYYNYIETNATLAAKNPSAYPSYLLSLGFVPIVFTPSCCPSTFATVLINRLDVNQLPYIKTKAYSFVTQHTEMDNLDAWMSKMDISRIFNVPVESIRSNDIIRRILNG